MFVYLYEERSMSNAVDPTGPIKSSAFFFGHMKRVFPPLTPCPVRRLPASRFEQTQLLDSPGELAGSCFSTLVGKHLERDDENVQAPVRIKRAGGGSWCLKLYNRQKQQHASTSADPEEIPVRL